MELPNVTTAGQAALPPAPQTAPSPNQVDGQAPADAKAVTTDPTPEVPLPIPASPTQSGLVSKASIEEREVAQKIEATGNSAVQRTLKPYGIIMLPEKLDAPQQEPDPNRPNE